MAVPEEDVELIGKLLGSSLLYWKGIIKQALKAFTQ